MKSGAAWGGFAIEAILGSVPHEEAYFWGTHNGAELDLLLFAKGKRIGFEFTLSPDSRVTPSMRAALADLGLDRLYVVHSGDKAWPLGERIEALPLAKARESRE